jgi:beta-galactosidase
MVKGNFIEVAESGASLSQVKLRVLNRYVFRDLSHLDWEWNITCDLSRTSIAAGSFAVTDRELKDGLTLTIDPVLGPASDLSKNVSARTSIRFWLNLRGYLNEDQIWCNKGRVLVTEQFELRLMDVALRDHEKTLKVAGEGPLALDNNEHLVSVSAVSSGQLLLEIDKKTGTIISLSTLAGTNLLAKSDSRGGIYPNFTRAYTDNDRGGVDMLSSFVLPSYLQWLNPVLFRIYGAHLSFSWFWDAHGLSPAFPPSVRCTSVHASETSDQVVVETSLSMCRKGHSSKELLMQNTRYIVFNDGKVKVESSVRPQSYIKNVPSLARIGLEAVLDSRFFLMTWCGRGKLENYPDRKASAEMGIWQTTVEENEFNYIVPSENGNKSDCIWVAFQDESGRGLCFVADPGGNNLNVGASLNSQAQLHNALHTRDVGGTKNEDGPIYARVDHLVMGLGGDASWFPAVYPQFLVKPDKEYNFSVWLIPLSEGDDPIIQAKNV